MVVVSNRGKGGPSLGSGGANQDVSDSAVSKTSPEEGANLVKSNAEANLNQLAAVAKASIDKMEERPPGSQLTFLEIMSQHTGTMF